MEWGKRGVGIWGVGCRGGGDLCKKANNYRIATKYIYICIFIFTFIYIYICGGWVRGVLNQSTTHCYFGDRDVHAMGTCSANLNDDHRGGVCACGCAKLREPL